MKLQDRWQVRAAIITAAVLYMLLPPKLTFGPGWIAPVVVVVLLVPIAALAPSPRFVKRVRVLSVVLIAVLNALNVASVALLIVDILDTHAKNHGVSAFELIRYGSLVWVTNVIVFGLWYWELDSGGQYARAACATAREFDQPDFLFPQLQMNANNLKLDPNWKPEFVDYLYLAFTNALAFSPADTMPLSRWAKALMLLEALISFITVALILARSVGILS